MDSSRKEVAMRWQTYRIDLCVRVVVVWSQACRKIVPGMRWVRQCGPIGGIGRQQSLAGSMTVGIQLVILRHQLQGPPLRHQLSHQ